METINSSNFEETIKDGVVVVDFSATWCGPCRMLAPILEQVEQDTCAKIVKVDIDESEDLARQFLVMAVPTLILFKDGKQMEKISGFMPKQNLISFIDRNL